MREQSLAAVRAGCARERAEAPFFSKLRAGQREHVGKHFADDILTHPQDGNLTKEAKWSGKKGRRRATKDEIERVEAIKQKDRPGPFGSTRVQNELDVCMVVLQQREQGLGEYAPVATKQLATIFEWRHGELGCDYSCGNARFKVFSEYGAEALRGKAGVLVTLDHLEGIGRAKDGALFVAGAFVREEPSHDEACMTHTNSQWRLITLRSPLAMNLQHGSRAILPVSRYGACELFAHVLYARDMRAVDAALGFGPAMNL